jgi:hypothetical protein
MPRLLACCVLALLLTFSAQEALARIPPPAPAPQVVVDAQGVAIGGHDAVAYFTEERAVLGSPDFEHRWNGAVWRFASAAARDRFAADPESYAPRYGGWCAWAMSENRVSAGDPGVWRIVDGRLYFNCSPEAQRRWEADRDAAIARGDAYWARLRAGDEAR